MKKLLATILALVMALGLCSVSWAADCTGDDNCTIHVAKIGNKHYESLTAAVEAVQSGETITMLHNYTDNGVQIKGGKNFTIDFAGYVLTLANPLVGSAGTETNGFQLLEGSTITFKNGTLRSEEAYILIQNYSNLTLENMTLDGSKIPVHKTKPSTVRYTLSNNSGTIIINNSTITAPETLGVAFDVCRYSNYTGPSVTVKGDSVINGKVEISSSGNKEGAVHKLIVESGTFNGDISVVGSNPNFEASISGGTFSNSVNPTYLADGLKYEVCAGGKYSYYSDFDTAAAAAAADGHEVIKVGNSGTGVVPFYIDYADGTGVKPKLWMSKDNFELPTPTRSGYTFKGWKIALHEGEQIPGFTGTYTSEQVKDIVFAEAATDGGAINRFSDGAYLTAVWSSNSYYYYPSTSDTTTSTTTKGSPKTFDAGVGIYAVTALLSVTGMAWAGKKRH